MKNRTTPKTTGAPKNRKSSSTTPSPRKMDKMVKEAYMGMLSGGIAEAAQEYNATPFKNKAIDLLNKQRYSISREFDGQEVEGTMMERPTIGGGRMEVERFNNMPGGGSFVERTRYNAEGMPVNRTIKDRKINPRQSKTNP
jgi:hypothetical protein